MTRPTTPAPRDQEESPFSDILRDFWRAHPTVLAAAFVDDEGECIDYFSCLDPFEAKVAAALLASLAATLRTALVRADVGEPRTWIIEAERRDLIMARACTEYAVVLVLQSHGVTARLLDAVDPLIEAFSREAGLALECSQRVPVAVGRDADGRSRPLSVHSGTEELPVLAVLARWSERGVLTERPRTCYRVLVPNGERTLVHDEGLDSWRIRLRVRDRDRDTQPPTTPTA